jgi:PBSX family phage portal protein
MALKLSSQLPPPEPSKAEKAKIAKSNVAKPRFIQKVIKGDTYLVLSASQQFPEDEFQGLYYSSAASSFIFIEPPFDPKYLHQLVTQNNTLAQCVEAMEVNIDGTGHELEPIDPEKPGAKDEITRINAFLAEPYPNQSFVSIRRKLRVELESIGYAALEILRNAEGKMVGLRNLPSHLLRWIRLDEPVQVTKKVIRNGEEVEMTYWDRERRYASRIGTNQYTFYRDYGTTRQCHRTTGAWEKLDDKGKPVDPIDPAYRASEILMFTVWADVQTPYGLPRWVNQMPSVLGSRKAEEATLEFLDSGGMPPAIFFIEGGTLAQDVAEQLKQFLSGHMKAKARGIVVEAQSSAGTLDSAGKVTVKTERFGHDGAKDTMYMNYDKATEEHVRVGFRLPPLFVGKAQDYNFATAQVGYMVAEAQVFQPERNEFDEVINRTVMKELDAQTVKFKSKPITLKDAQAQINLLTHAKGMVEGSEWVEEANKVSGLTMKFNQTAQMDENGTPLALPTNPSTVGPGDGAGSAGPLFGGPPDTMKPSGPPNKKSGPDANPRSGGKVATKGIREVAKMAHDFCAAEGLILTKFDPSRSEKETIRKSVDALPEAEKKLLLQFVGVHLQRALDAGEIGPAVAA